MTSGNIETATCTTGTSPTGTCLTATCPTGTVRTLVKWDSPLAEAQGIACGAAALLRDKRTMARHIGFAVPNRTWAGQLAQACKVMGVAAEICEGRLDAEGNRAAIFDFRLGNGAFDWLFVVGCTEGLMPTAAAIGEDPASREALAIQREAFAQLTSGEHQNLVLSYFCQADKALADHIRLPYRRTATRGGVVSALCAPSRFIGEMGAQRPSTIGGQRFLRDADLN
ncbi:hypothetical protein VJ923_02945 [Adlercreutzia sp. R25]|uniref:hypothetical protein n=1 Tax=Adlercreutzia shanghongiae TaxID=3111773 RepID=UPI002DBFC649|nr:hypothetical protein [Adlercreutzia sp. R25]MEC4272115.1 hypothetical protein [Adlercreutzia sp. R25]